MVSIVFYETVGILGYIIIHSRKNLRFIFNFLIMAIKTKIKTYGRINLFLSSCGNLRFVKRINTNFYKSEGLLLCLHTDPKTGFLFKLNVDSKVLIKKVMFL